MTRLGLPSFSSVAARSDLLEHDLKIGFRKTEFGLLLVVLGHVPVHAEENNHH